MDCEERNFGRRTRARSKGSAIEQRETLGTKKVRDGFARVTVKINNFNSLFLKQARGAVQYWKLVLFDIDLQHQIAERQRQGIEPLAPHIDDPIALIGR